MVAGNALEVYDFVIYSLFSIQIGHAFYPSKSAYASLMLSLATFGAGFLTRPLGAIVLGGYADRVGRKAAMMLCFVLIGVAIVGMAVVPPYSSIGVAAPILAVLARMTMGFSLGGEIGTNTAYLAEAAPPHNRGLVISWQPVGQALAFVAGGLVGLAVTTWLPATAVDAYGWRIAFLLGAITVPFGLWLRTRLPETLHSAEEPGIVAAAAGESRLVLARRTWRIFGLGLMYIASGTMATYVFNYVATYAQATLHLSARVGYLAETGGYLISIPVVLLSGWLSDRYGRKPINVYGNLVLLVLTYPTFVWIVRSGTPGVFLFGMMLLSVVSSISVIYVSISESIPKSIRGSGFSLTYSLAVVVFGSTTQPIVTWLIHATGNPMAPGWYLTGAAVLGQIAVMLFPESAPVRLAAKSRAALSASA